MGRLEEFPVDGKNVVFIDFSNICKINEFVELIEQVKLVMAKYQEKSVYTITNIENVRFDSSVKDEMVKYMAFNKTYVKSGAVIGIDGIKKIMANTIIKLSGRSNFNFFFTRNEAVNWIKQQE